MEHGENRPERRGGSRRTEQQIEVSESIEAHIRTFKVVESHYGRDKSCRQYLASDLNIRKMFLMWEAARKESNLPTANRSTLRTAGMRTVNVNKQ